MRWRRWVAWPLAGALAMPAAAYHPGDMLVAATAPGGGALAVRYDFARPVYVSPSIALGDVVLHTGTDPGFDGLEGDEAPLVPLAPGTPVTFELVGLGGPVSVQLKGPILGVAGQTALVGIMTADGDGLHVHPTWRLAIPAGAGLVQACVTFRLSTSGGYGASPAYTVVVTNASPDAPPPAPPPCATPPPCAGAAPGSDDAIDCRLASLREAIDDVPAPDRGARRAARAAFRHVSTCARLLDGPGARDARRASRVHRRVHRHLAALERLAARASARGTLPSTVAAELRARVGALREELDRAAPAGFSAAGFASAGPGNG